MVQLALLANHLYVVELNQDIPRFIKFEIYTLNQERRGIMPRFSGNKYSRFIEARYIIRVEGIPLTKLEIPRACPWGSSRKNL